MQKNQKLFDLEKDIATLLVNKLEDESISKERAAAIAFFIITALPPDMTDEQLAQILPKLDDEFFELSQIVNMHIQAFESGNKEIVLTGMKDLVDNQQFAEAKTLLTAYFLKK